MENNSVEKEANSGSSIEHNAVLHSEKEIFISPAGLWKETLTSSDYKYLPDQTSSTITSADKTDKTVEDDLIIITGQNDVRFSTDNSQSFSVESSSMALQISTTNGVQSVTSHVSQHEASAEKSHITRPTTNKYEYEQTSTVQETPSEQKLSTEQSSVPVTSSAPSKSDQPTMKPQTTRQLTTQRTSLTSTSIETTTSLDTTTSTVGSLTGSPRQLTTSVDVTSSPTHKTTSTHVPMTSLVSVNNSSFFSTKDTYPRLTSEVTNADSVSTVASTITSAPSQLPLTYIIAGAAGFAVLFIVLMCIVVVCICRKRQRKNSGLDEFDYGFDLRARSRRAANGPARVSYSFTQRAYSNNSFSDIPGALSGLGSASTGDVATESNMKKSHSNSDNLLTRYNLEPNIYISEDEPASPLENGLTSPVTGNVCRNSGVKFDRNEESVKYSTFKRAPKGVELAEGFQGELLV